VTLIVVSGAPGTGKSTIAAALGTALRFPVLSLDPIKEALADVLGLGGEDWSNQVGDAAAEVVFRLGSGLIEVDTGAPGAAGSAVTAVRSALSL
jgi:predicted kinase